MRDGARGIQSVEVSGRILRALANTCTPMMLKELALAADLAPAQCHAYLTSLRHVDLVHQDPRTGLYSTGSFALRLGIGWLHSNALASTAIYELKGLTAELGHMSLLAVLSQWGPTIVHMNTGMNQTALNLRPGTIYSVTGTATGRVFAAFADSPIITARIEEEFSQPGRGASIGSVIHQSAFEETLAETRSLGFALAAGTPIPGINAVSAPIFGSDGKLAFVATLVGAVGELTVERDSNAVTRLVAVARALSGGKVVPQSDTGPTDAPSADEQQPTVGVGR